ncbi:MAG: hypothetical protein OEW68_03520 [Gammaproteobacteria bacterium]|nr:hypothetical protein [Gammaproteobacteria bacterium]
MNLLMLILIFLGVLAASGVFYIAWRLSSDDFIDVSSETDEKEEPGDAKE